MCGNKNIKTSAYFFISFFLFLGCTNDLKKIKKIAYDKKSPEEISNELTIYHTDNEYATYHLFAQHAERYADPPRTVIKEHLKVDFFDKQGNISSTLTAKYGEINMDKNTMFVRDSVQLVNHEDQRTLYTNILHWNVSDSTIYTNEKVRLVSPKGTAYGTSLRAKQDFSHYKITDPQGAYEFE